MSIESCFQIWNELSEIHKEQLLESTIEKKVKAKTLLSSGKNDCLGLIAIQAGQLRAFMTSESGKEITLYRLFPSDICLFSAACAIEQMSFDIQVEAKEDSQIFVIPSQIYKKVMEESAILANYTTAIMSRRFSDVMWLVEQIMWHSFDRRLMDFLQKECELKNSRTLHITHEMIANELGSAREVVSRMLKHFEEENLVTLSRNCIVLN